LQITVPVVTFPESGMKPGTLLLIASALCCGLTASYLTGKALHRGSTRPLEGPPITVLVARRTIAPMTLLKDPEKLFEEIELPPASVPANAITEFEGLKNRRMNKLIGAGRCVTSDDVVSPDLEGGSQIRPGRRVFRMKLPADPRNIVLPTSRVDVYGTSRQETGEERTRLVVSNLEVIGLEMMDPDYVVIILSVLPEECLQLVLAEALGDVRLLTRLAGGRPETAVPAGPK
jgi:Flp pilus assembly protein CpaB